MTQLWRIHTRPSHKEEIDPTRFCVENNVVGVGWAVEATEDIADWKTYEELVKCQEPQWLEDNSFIPAMNALIDYMQLGDLIWTRSRDGIYYLGKCTGHWRHTVDPRFKDADTVNIRDCQWKEVGVVTKVPGKVVNSFIPSRTIQRIYDDSALGYSQLLLNETVTVPIDDIFSLMSAEDLEDLVALYLQRRHGHFLVPSSRSRKDDTLMYEYIMMDKSGQDIAVQVKSGDVSINVADYSELSTRAQVFLFCPSGNYIGLENQKRITGISPEEIKNLIESESSLLPFRIRRWKQYLGGCGL